MPYLYIYSEEGGTTDPSPGARNYPVGTSVTVTAKPDPGMQLASWAVDGVAKPAAATITVVTDVYHLLEARWSKAPPAPPVLYTCPTCGATFKTQAELDTHIANMHPPTPTNPWPWPLNQVYDWFQNLWNSILGAVSNVIAPIQNFLWDKILWLRDRVSDGWASISSYVWERLLWLRDRVVESVSALSSLVSEKVIWLRDRVGEGWTWIVAQVTGKIDWLRDRVVEVGATLSQGLQDRVIWLRDRASELWTMVSQGIIDRTNWLRDRLGEGLNWIGQQLTLQSTNIITNFTRAFDDAGHTIIGGIVKPLQDFANWLASSLNAGALALLTAIQERVIGPTGAFLRSLVDTVASYFTAGLQSFVNFLVRPGHKEPETAYGEMPTLVLQTSALGLGVCGLIAAAQTKVVGTGLELSPMAGFFMSLMPTALVDAAFIGTAVQIGYVTPLRYYYNSVYTPMLPGSGDLIKFVVREVITPQDFARYMAYEGYSDYWAAAYWQAHWVLPPLDRVYDAFHRGVVDEPFVRSFLVLADYEAKYHDLLLSTIYTLIPRVDLRYGWETGALSDEDLYNYLRRHGFDDASATAEVTIQKRRVLESELNAMRIEAVNDYVDGFIDEDQLAANLAATGLRPELVDYRVAAAKLKRTRAERKEQISSFKTLYLKGGYSVANSIEDLKAIGLVQEEAVSTVQAWEILRKPAKVVEEKRPEDDVQAQLTLNEEYGKILEADIADWAKKRLDVYAPKFLLEQGTTWSKRAAEELAARRIPIALDMARLAETIIKQGETRLREAALKATSPAA